VRVTRLARAWILLLGLPLASTPAAAQSGFPEPNSGRARASPAPIDPVPADLPVSLDRIREALERAPQPVIVLPEQPSFSIVIEGKLPNFEDFVEPGELQSFAMPSALSHQEFLSMVTPTDYRAPFTSGELAQVVATGIAGSLAMSAITKAVKEGWRARRERRAQDEVEAVLEALWERDGAAAERDGQAPSRPPP
jgi:hypothetical protein